MSPTNFAIILLASLILKTLIKILRWLIETFIKREKTLNLQITTTKLKYLLQREMMNLICLVDPILYLIFKIILSTSSKNTRL